MEFTTEVNARLEARYLQLKLAIEKNPTIGLDLWTYFTDSESQLINLMNNRPPSPDAPGNIEVSWALYFLNNKTPNWLKSKLKDLGMPGTRISANDWTIWSVVWENQGVVMGDGSLVSTAWYAILDVGWSVALLDYFLLYLGWTSKHPFGVKPVTLTITKQKTLRIALFGDWGSGSYADGNLPASPSQLIGQQITAQKPDISIHLGDVYYSGTQSEEQKNLLKNWPRAKLGNFTLNSNHEMYDGANGLFNTALTDPVFSVQNGTTYFQLEFGNWLIVALDTAYYDTSTLYMTGALTDANQISFLQKAGKSGKKIMLLTHHNPLDFIGNQQTSLWSQVVKALGKTPDYWYWGHVHNGMVYSSVAAGGATRCRCLGNAAIPIGNASWLSANAKTISYYTNKPITNPDSKQILRVMNGFAMLTFHKDTVDEKWYYQDGSTAWSS